MHRLSRPEVMDFPSAQVQRTQSLSSDRLSSMSLNSPLASPPAVEPEPAFIAASAASQIVTSDHQNREYDWFEEEGNSVDAEPALVSPASLALINTFLDNLLFSFLASSRSTSIAALRPAVQEVLKPRLAKDAIDGADQELQEFLGGGDDEELTAFHHGQESRGKYDLNLIWRRTRLRCMVYTRLGDMEEEDEEMYIEREHLEDANDERRRVSRDLGLVSPAAAIFLTSILEFIGEHALIMAGEAAYNRQRSGQHHHGNGSSRTTGVRRVVVEDIDMEKLAFNTTLGRLWRSWKKRVRSSSVSNHRPLSGVRATSTNGSTRSSRTASPNQMDGPNDYYDYANRPSVAEVLQTEPDPMSIPLPSTANDVAEIEVPNYSSELAGRKGNRGSRDRPLSVVEYPNMSTKSTPPESSQPEKLTDVKQRESKNVPPIRRHRSSSLPNPQQTRYELPKEESLASPVKDSEPLVHKHEGRVYNKEDLPWLADKSSPGSEVSSLSTPVAAVVDGEKLTSIRTSNASIPRGSSQESGCAEREESSTGMGEYDLNTIPQAMNYSQGLAQTLSRAASSNYSLRSGNVTHGRPADTEKQQPAPKADMAREEYEYDNQALLQKDDVSASRVPKFERENEVRCSGHLEDHANVAAMQNNQLRDGNHESSDMYQGVVDRSHKYDATLTSVVRETYLTDPSRSTIKSSNPAAGVENGAPALTPLRELVDAAHDTSDEASSLAPSHDTSRSGAYAPADNVEVIMPGALSTSIFAQVKPASKLSDYRNQLPPVYTGPERATVQRVVPSPGSPRDPLTPQGRNSSSSNRDLRPVHTSGSGTSQVSQKLKGFLSRESSDGSRQPVLSRNSSEGNGSIISDKHSLRTPKADDKQQSFEQLIKSDETIQYTLTPHSMRKMEVRIGSSCNSLVYSDSLKVPESPRHNLQRRSEVEASSNLSRNTSQSTTELGRSATTRSSASLKGRNGLRSNPTTSLKETKSPSAQIFSSTGPALQAHPPRSPGNGRPAHAAARDARIEKETSRDFEDFIRSTGPEHEPTPNADAKSVNGSRTNLVLKEKSRPSSRQGQGQGLPRKVIKPDQNAAPSRADVVAPVRSRSKLQAREPTVSSRDTNELIDFIRQGPGHDWNNGTARTPMSLSTSRATRNSEEARNLGYGTSKDMSRTSVASTLDSSAPTQSVNSTNSRTGLLGSSSKSNVKRTVFTQDPPARFDEPPHPPKRRQRRVKDPYAIDSDSDEGYMGGRKSHDNEESLMDFLRSVTPPPSVPRVPSAFDDIPKPRGWGIHREASGASGSITRERLTKNSPANPPPKNLKSLPSSAASARGRTTDAPQLPPFNPRETSPHLITQIGSKLDTYKPTKPTYAAHVDRERNGPARAERNGSNARLRQNAQPRAEREDAGGVGDLADFLKNSAPPPPPVQQRSTGTNFAGREEGGLRGFFGRRKKVVGRGF
jgi:hypothetical protein